MRAGLKFKWQWVIFGLIFQASGLPIAIETNEAVIQSPIRPVKVAFLYSKTGSHSFIEKEMRRGADLFISQSQGALPKIEIDFYDNQGTVTGTLAQLKKIKEKEISYLVGLSGSEEALTAAQFAEENDMIFLTPLATFSRISIGKKNTFQLSANDVLQGAALARFTHIDLKRTRVLVLINTRSIYSEGLAEGYQNALKGVQGVSIEKHLSSGHELHLENLKTKIAKMQPDLIFISDDILNSAILAKYIHTLDPLIPFLSGSQFGNDKAMKILLKEVPKMRVYYATSWSERENNIENDKFKLSYREKYGRSLPTPEAALSFDSLQVLAQALLRADTNSNLDRVRYFLEHLIFNTTQGKISFVSGPTHSPIKDVHIQVSNISTFKFMKTLRTTWKAKP